MPKKRKPDPPAPDTARVYERAKPECESSAGRLDAPAPPLSKRPDEIHKAVHNRQENERQINSEDVLCEREKRTSGHE